MGPRTPSRSVPGGDRLGQEDREVRAAARFAGLVTAIALAFVVIAVLWVSTCNPGSATAGCGRQYRTVLAVGAPVILAAGGLRAFARTYRVWRGRGTWWGWQGAGWFLLTLMLVVLLVSAVPIMGVDR
ncbi:hypothetical protein [[Mycobacterium] holstebronense]|uniref:Transmembrane protein n=1 Tax=[Mycobacterium] holstebronense TaxID=3064288 RepID=A0ABM9M0D9_9MYCO|nr:hypothetical protein [Mycolicibacter sp. MU0102]CAJ1507943.1 hypothetical protein MU0102_003241 [Mycolicibacter sp. MU0102]